MHADELLSRGYDASWLCPAPLDRARMLELDARLGSSANVIRPIFPLSMLVAAFWVGPWALLPLLEEFLLLLPGVGILEGQELAERLRKAVAAATPGGLPVTASFGVSAARGTDIEFEKLFRAADRALYAAKNAGRNAVMAASVPNA